MTDRSFDAIVIGGGMTGTYAAKNLCQAGLKTLLLERGPMKPHEDGTPDAYKDPWDYRFRGMIDDRLAARQQVQSKLFLYSAATARTLVDDVANPYSTEPGKPFTWFRAHQLGGKSLQWGRMCYRLSDLDFGANSREGIGNDWPIRYSHIAPFYEEVEKFIGVSGSADGIAQLPDGAFLPPMQMNDMELLMREVIQRKWPERRMIMGRVANLTKRHNQRGPCLSRDRCALGCPYGGYYSALSGAIPVALETGKLEIECDAIVERLIFDRKAKKAAGVRVINANTREVKEYRAPIIFLCAGTLNTTRILLQSAEVDGVGLSSGQLGHNLMDHHHMVMTGVIDSGPGTYPQGRRPTRCYLPRFRNLSQTDRQPYRRGFGFELSAAREDWTKDLNNALVGTELKRSISQWGKWRVIMVGFGECLPDHRNRVELDHGVRDAWGIPTLRIHAEFGANERAMNRDMIACAREMMKELGGRDIELWKEISDPGESIHEMGTARMGSDPRSSVLDPFNRMWDADNVYVTDGSAMPSSGCQNPSLTYMAMTARAVRHAVASSR